MPLLRDRLLRYRLVVHVNSPKLFNPLIALRISIRISLLAGLSVICVVMMVAAHFFGDAAVRRAFEKEDRHALQADYTVKIETAAFAINTKKRIFSQSIYSPCQAT